MNLSDHHATIAGIMLTDIVPRDAIDAFDRARSVFVLAFFNYDL